MNCNENLKEILEMYGESYLPFVSGFIAPDGTVIDIGSDDHTILNRECWNALNLVVYRFTDRGKTLNLRVFNWITEEQKQKLLERIHFLKELYIDVYLNDKLILSKEYENIDNADLRKILDFLNEVFEEVRHHAK